MSAAPSEESSHAVGTRWIWRAGWVRALGRGLTAAALLALSLPPEQAGAQWWRADLELRAGAMDGPGALGNVFKVVMGPRGEILATQPEVSTISVFDSTGQFLRDIGRSGGGPGEFGVPGALGWTGDTLWVMDVGQQRVHLFDRDLSYARTVTPVPLESPDPRMRLLPGPLLADGSVLAIPLVFVPADSQPLILLEQNGEVRRLPGISNRGHTVRLRGSLEPLGVTTNPWSDSDLWTPAADGKSIIVVHRPIATREDQGKLQILRLGLNGDTLVNQDFVYRPRPLRDQEAERVYREMAERFGRNRNISAAVARIESDLRSSVPAPRFYPAVTELISGDDGTIWLRREAPSQGQEEWQVFSADGEMLGRVRLPEGLRLHGADARRVWGVMRDELDVSFVEVYALELDRAR